MRRPSTPTKSSPRRLSAVARHVVLPAGVVSTAWPAVEAQAAQCGIRYDDWQRALGRCLLARNAQGRYAAGIGGSVVSICRQAGKTFLISTMVVMLCIIATRPLKVLWTAHRTRTSDETFRAMCSLIKKESIARFVAGQPRKANGQQEIGFSNGSRILFGARENGFGRGFDSVDIEIFDEAQILTERALDDMIPATNASPDPLIIYIGTPPKPTDPSDAFSSRREEALSGKSTDLLFVEFSADEDADPDDRTQWRKANPSYPARTSAEAIQRMRRNLGEDSFRREGLGIWDRKALVKAAIDPEKWQAGTVETRRDGGVTSFGVDMSPDRSSLCIGACMRYADGSAHVELAEIRDPHRDGTAWAVDWLAQRWPRSAAVMIDAQSPAMVLLPELTARGVKTTVGGTRDMAQACGRVLDMVDAGTLHHLPDEDQPQLARAVAGTVTRPIGKAGGFGWRQAADDIDISPLVAVTMALQGAVTAKRDPTKKARMLH